MADIKHKYVAPFADDPTDAAAGDVLPSHWNDSHSVSFAAADFVSYGLLTSASAATSLTTFDLTVNRAGKFLESSLSAGEPVVLIDSGTVETFPHGWGNTFKLTANRYPALWLQGSNSLGVIYAYDSLAQQFWLERIAADRSFDKILVWSMAAGVYGPDTDGDWNLGTATKKWGNIYGNTLTISATASVGALTVAGSPVASGSHIKLASTTGFASANAFKISGDWSSYQTIELDIQGKGAAATTNLIINLYTDGGTTPFMTYTTNPIASATASDFAAHFLITGVRNSGAMKVITPLMQMFANVTNQAGQFPTATFTASAINAISIITGTGATTTTMSSAEIFVYGRGV